MASPTQNQVQSPLPNADLFDAYFRRADFDRDGRISGAEAVSFFQASGLPKQVLAQIWAIANQSQTGFLGRAEFYNALKLVTVAQSKRDLTPEIVRAALYGPAAAKIPPPQMNFNATPTPQFNASAAAPAQSLGSATPSTPSVGSRGPQGPGTAVRGGVAQLPPNVTAMQQSQLVRTPQLQSPSISTSIPVSDVSTQRFGVAATAGGTTTGGGTQNVSAIQQSELMRPPQVQSIVSSSFSAPAISTHGFGGVSVARPDWSGSMTGSPAGTFSQVQAGGISLSSTQDGFKPVSPGSGSAVLPRPQSPSGMQPSGQVIKDSKTLENSGNGFSSDPFFGGDVFSAMSSQPNKDASPPTSSAQTAPPSMASSGSVLPSSVAGNALSSSASGIQHSPRPGGPDSLQRSFPIQPAGGQHQQALFQSPSIPRPSALSVGPQNLDASQSQHPWPKMTQTDIQKYTKVFVEVDKDRDGKITGEQARSLFLSWKLPREVLKHVWDLSDQDNDSMLSLREFCIALYLMERYREGRSLPQTLPSSIMFDLSNVGQPMTQNINAAWRPTSGFQEQQQRQRISASGARQLNPVAGRPPRPPSIPPSEEAPQINQLKSKVPELESHLVNQLSSDEQDSLNSKFKEAKEADKKVEELEKEIVDSREKIEFYRNKMQELVLYKSRCDNRLNEITERVSADKHEVESLTKKYEDKYKQTGDVASKLTAEEATFRDIQEKKMELYQAILKIEHDGKTDEAQAHADHIQSDLDEVVKSMNERCKKYGLRTKPMTLVELPFGWQPGIQEGAADWDEHWDKFEDQGFTFVKELTLDVQNIIAPPKHKLSSSRNDKAPTSDSATSASSPKAKYESEEMQREDENAVENGSTHDKSEDALARSEPSTPISRKADANASEEVPDSNLQRVSVKDTVPHDKDAESDLGDLGPAFSGGKSFDEPKWGTFDASDDTDSLWGFNFTSTGKDTDHERNGNDYAFDSGDFGLKPIKTGSPRASEIFPKRSGFTFDDSVPSTPLSIFSTGDTPKRSKDWSEPAFDSFARFDSFRTHDSGFFPQQGNVARFDSMRSSQDFDQSHQFPAFDESDPFGSGPFKTSMESQTPSKTSDSRNAF